MVQALIVQQSGMSPRQSVSMPIRINTLPETSRSLHQSPDELGVDVLKQDNLRLSMGESQVDSSLINRNLSMRHLGGFSGNQLISPSLVVPFVPPEGYTCFDATTRVKSPPPAMMDFSMMSDCPMMEQDDDDSDDPRTAISPRSSVDESQGYKTDSSWDDGASQDSLSSDGRSEDGRGCSGPLWPENAYRREMLDYSINKLQAMQNCTTRSTCLRKSVLIFNTMKCLQDELASSPALDQESFGDEDLELDSEDVEDDEYNQAAPFGSTNLSEQGYSSCHSIWSPNQVVVPHPWSAGTPSATAELQSNPWTHSTHSGYTQHDQDSIMDHQDGSHHDVFNQMHQQHPSGTPFSPAFSSNNGAKRQCVSREIVASSYELLNQHQSANGAFGLHDSFQGSFDPMHHEGLGVLASLGIKDLSQFNAA